MRKLFTVLVNILIIIGITLILFGAFLFICEDIFGVTPHLYFTSYTRK